MVKKIKRHPQKDIPVFPGDDVGEFGLEPKTETVKPNGVIMNLAWRNSRLWRHL